MVTGAARPVATVTSALTDLPSLQFRCSIFVTFALVAYYEHVWHSLQQLQLHHYSDVADYSKAR